MPALLALCKFFAFYCTVLCPVLQGLYPPYAGVMFTNNFQFTPLTIQQDVLQY